MTLHLYWYDRYRVTSLSKCDTLEEALDDAMGDHERGEAAYVGIEVVEDDGTSRIINFDEMYSLWSALHESDEPDPDPEPRNYWAVTISPPGGGRPCLADTFIAEEAAHSVANQMHAVLGDRVSYEHRTSDA